MIKLSLQKITLPGKFNISDIECVLVLDEGQALARAGLEILFYISILMIIIDKIIDPKAKMKKLVCLYDCVYTWSICTATEGTCGDYLGRPENV